MKFKWDNQIRFQSKNSMKLKSSGNWPVSIRKLILRFFWWFDYRFIVRRWFSLFLFHPRRTAIESAFRESCHRDLDDHATNRRHFINNWIAITIDSIKKCTHIQCQEKKKSTDNGTNGQKRHLLESTELQPK